MHQNNSIKLKSKIMHIINLTRDSTALSTPTHHYSYKKSSKFNLKFKEEVDFSKYYALNILKNTVSIMACIRELKKLVYSAFTDADNDVIESTYLLIGKLYMIECEYTQAKEYFKMSRALSNRLKHYIEEIKAYNELGNLYIKIKEYKKANISFKKLLELAWYHDNIAYEIKAYDSIGLVYYYKNNLQKAFYYHNRYVNGLYESEASNLRKTNKVRKDDRERLKSIERGEYFLVGGSLKESLYEKYEFQKYISSLYLVRGEESVEFYTGTPISNLSESSVPSPSQQSIDEEIQLFPQMSWSSYKKSEQQDQKRHPHRPMGKFLKQLNTYKKKIGISLENTHKIGNLKSTEQRLSERLSPKFSKNLTIITDSTYFTKRVNELHSSMSNVKSPVIISHLKSMSRCSDKKKKVAIEKKYTAAINEICTYKNKLSDIFAKRNKAHFEDLIH